MSSKTKQKTTTIKWIVLLMDIIIFIIFGNRPFVPSWKNIILINCYTLVMLCLWIVEDRSVPV